MSARLSDSEVFDSAKLKNTVRFLIENDMRNVVIDLGDLEYLYSDTINAFIASNRHMLEVSGRIAILTEHPKVQDILKRAGLDNIMRIYRSEAEMLADSKEILRQTSSYRIEELQKFSAQTKDQAPAARTEFDDFKAEMGQNLGSKLENNQATQFPTFKAPTFNSPPVPETPSLGFPQKQNTPAFGAGSPSASFQNQPLKNFNQTPAPSFDFPSAQMPVGQFGLSTAQQPPTPPSQSGIGQGTPPREPTDEGQADPRQRMPSQDRARPNNARRQQGRRVGGREVPGQEEDQVAQEFTSYGEDRSPEPPVRESDNQIPYNTIPGKSTNLADEARFPAKLIVALLLIAAGVGGYFFLSRKGAQEEVPPISVPAVPEPVETTPAAEPVAPIEPTAVTPTEPAAATPVAPEVAPNPAPVAEPVPAPAVATQPLNPVPKAKAPVPVAATPKAVVLTPVTPLVPTPKVPKVAVHKPTAVKVEKPTPEPKITEEPDNIAPPTKGLRITSNPPGAEVLINFSKKGSTPLDVVLNNNSNKIIVRLSGYKRYETTLPKNHPDHELEVELEREEAVEAPQPKVVAKPITKPEPKVEPKPAPEPKYQEYQEPEDMPIAKSKPEKIERAEPPPSRPAPDPTPGDGPIGIIFLSSSPARADIFIDGKNTGKKTPAKIELPSGNHTIEMSKSGQKSSINQVVNEGKNKAVHLTLQ